MLADVIQAVLPALEKVIPDVNAREKAAREIALLQMQGTFDMARGQLEVNKVEAAHPSIWTSGWRPAIGWTCAAAIFANYVGLPIAQMVGYGEGLVPLDLTQLWPVVLGMLGLGSLRSIEKIKGAAR